MLFKYTYTTYDFYVSTYNILNYYYYYVILYGRDKIYLCGWCWIRRPRTTTPSGWTFCSPGPRTTRIPVSPVPRPLRPSRPRSSSRHRRCSGGRTTTSVWACSTTAAVSDCDGASAGRRAYHCRPVTATGCGGGGDGGATVSSWPRTAAHCPAATAAAVAAVRCCRHRPRCCRRCYCSWPPAAGPCCTRSLCAGRTDICPTAGTLSGTGRKSAGPLDRYCRCSVLGPYPL